MHAADKLTHYPTTVERLASSSALGVFSDAFPRKKARSSPAGQEFCGGKVRRLLAGDSPIPRRAGQATQA